eukprot:jgi/Orpsp1_1/1176483/evm.model.c7180000057803.1
MNIKNDTLQNDKLNVKLENSLLKQMYKEVNNYLNEAFKLNNIGLNTIFDKAILLNDYKKGLYSHPCSKENIECEAIRCSLNFTGNFPLAQTVLYCNNDTTEEEIISFIYRSITCQYKALFMIIKPENLKIEKKHLLLELLQEHYSQDMISCLLILYVKEKKKNEMITEIENISNFRYTDFKLKDGHENRIKLFPEVKVYSIEYCGLGKSTLIKTEFDKMENSNEYEYIYLQIGGNINEIEILNKLLKLTNKKISLHLDICESNQIDLIREFLFSFLILKCYNKNENIFYYENEIRIKIEIPNSFVDFKKLFPILDFFENICISYSKKTNSENIKYIDLPPLIVPNDLTSDVQILCNYLNVYNNKNINEYDIYIKGINVIENEDIKKNKKFVIIDEPLEQKDCQNLLNNNFKRLKAKNLNYYQIKSYITIVSEQLRLLSKSLYLNAEHLNHIVKIKRRSDPNSNEYNDLNKVREYFIDTLLKITLHVVTSSYNNILKGQSVTYGQQSGKIDIEKAKEQASEALAERLIFSIDDQPSMIFINEDCQSITEICNCNKNTHEYNLLKALINSGSENNEFNVIDYSKLTSNEFLIELRKVLYLFNRMDENDKDYPDKCGNKKLKYLKDICKSYVFTKDNFIKLILISLRLRTNIPVILQGETGCGKTSLIKIIAELKEIPLHILNIHAGIEDSDIINFIKKNKLFENDELNEKSDSNREDKNNNDIWVFLDELNTCNSLGLITELMLKHTCKGEKIKRNVKFIGACNPYRLDISKKEIHGLYDENKYKNKRLVYTVNPLPQSLLNFIFDFGTPKRDDIKRYISNMVHKTLEETISDNRIFNEIKPKAEIALFNAHEFIKKQYDISTENRKMSMENIAKFSLFLESYKIYIYFLVEFISFMDKNVNGFLNNYISIISKSKFKNINNDDKKIKNVNNIFFNIFESVVYCIFNIQNFENIFDEIFENIMKELKIFLQNLMKVNNELILMLKQILCLDDFILVSDYFNKNGIPLKENLQKYLQILINENKIYLLKEKDDDTIDKNIIVDEFKFLKNKLKRENDYSDLIVKLLNNKIKISRKDEYREELLNVLCSENYFIIKSKIIFETFLKRFNLCPIDKTNKISNNNNNNNQQYNNEDKFDYEEESDEEYISGDESDENEKQEYNIFLNEILLSIFDKEFSIYFKNKKSKENLILNQSFDIFKKCVGYVENENCEITKNNKLGILYCISYIKTYCYHLSNILISDNEDEIFKDDILNFLNIPSEFRKVIKIYILKLLNGIYIGNYKKLVYFVNEKKLFNNDFDFTETVPSSLDYLFIQNESFDNYKKLRDIYILNRSNNFRNSRDILLLINQNKEKRIFNFYDLIINEETSNIINNFQKERYKKLSQYTLNIVNNLNLTSLSKNLLNIYFDYNSLNNKIREIQGFSIPKYEMLLYSHKFAFICSLSNSNSVYSKILSPDVLNNLEKIYIPGGEPNDSRIIRTVREIKEFYQNGGNDGIYKCSCNYWYFIGNCGYPMMIFKCKECGQLIGGINHKLVDRPGHVRIYMDEAHRNNDKYRSSFPVSYIFFNQLRADAEKENIPIKGFKKVKRDFFIDTKKQVRNISQVTYRILSFIFYSCIYYNEKLEYINSNDIKNFYYSDAQNINQSILFILEEIWKLLIDELIKRNVNNIRCFLNLIIPEITKLIINNNSGLETLQERNTFETACNNIIENEIKNYVNDSEIYNNNNKSLLNIKDDTIKSILQETSDINKLPQNYYPLIKYFNITNYPNFDNFNVQFESIPNRNKTYPIITNYLYAIKNIEIDISEFLKNFNLINPLITYCLNKYNNKISRKEAKKIKIYKELQNDDNMRILFKNFKNGWENIYKRLSNYDCHGQLHEKNITESDCLAYILNDNLEDGYGKYVATAYKDMITYQNEFLKPLITNDPSIDYLHTYSNQIKNGIIIQKANPDNIVTLDIKNDIFDSFGKIKYDFETIEKELTKILLYKKCLFKNEQEMEFITYSFEGFNQNESIISNFREKIKNLESLTSEEKESIDNLIKRIDYKTILFNLQSLLLYFNNERNINGNEILPNEINHLPKSIIRLDTDFINIFKNTQLKDLKLNKLISFYEYIEFINYDKILKNVPRNTESTQEELKEINQYINAYFKLEKEQIDNLNKHFENENELLISFS